MDNNSTIYYKFTADSAFNFPVTHRGRKIFVNFSLPVNGVSRFLTTDKGLADKICAHRWFRMGLIHMVEEKESAPAQKVAQKPSAPAPQKPAYSIIGRKMAAKMPSFMSGSHVFDNAGSLHKDADAAESDASQSAEAQTASESAEPQQQAPTEEASQQFRLEDVTSFLEAKEYFTSVMGVNRSLASSKEAIAALCRQYNITFPNYKL